MRWNIRTLLLEVSVLAALAVLPATCDTITRPFIWDAVNGLRVVGVEGDTFGCINDNGVILGHSNGRACIWDGETKRELGGLPGYSECGGADINNSGQVVGGCRSPYYRSFIWDAANGMRDIGVPYSLACDINDSGMVLGQLWGSSSEMYTWTESGGRTDIPTPDFFSHLMPVALNNNGTVVGFADGSQWSGIHGFVWDNERGFTNLGKYIKLFDVNDHNQAVGERSNRPIIWDAVNGLQDLGFLPGYDTGYATSINNAGQVCGWLYVSGRSRSRCSFIWDKANGMRRLETPDGWDTLFVTDINNNGVVVGYAARETVPEPSSVLALLCGIGGMGSFALRRRK